MFDFLFSWLVIMPCVWLFQVYVRLEVFGHKILRKYYDRRGIKYVVRKDKFGIYVKRIDNE